MMFVMGKETKTNWRYKMKSLAIQAIEDLETELSDILQQRNNVERENRKLDIQIAKLNDQIGQLEDALAAAQTTITSLLATKYKLNV